MSDNVTGLPSSKAALEIQRLTLQAAEIAREQDLACVAITLVGKDGTVRNLANIGAHALALLGALDTLKQHVYTTGISEANNGDG